MLFRIGVVLLYRGVEGIEAMETGGLYIYIYLRARAVGPGYPKSGF